MTSTPKVVTFQEEKDKPKEQKPEFNEKEFGHSRDKEMVEFIADEDDEDSISGLSRSIGKLWDAESMIDVWETNSQGTVESPQSSSLRVYTNLRSKMTMTKW